MGVRTYHRCLSIAVITILLLLLIHVAVQIWVTKTIHNDLHTIKEIRSYPAESYTRPSVKDYIRPKKHKAARKHSHEKRTISDVRLPSPIQMLDMNCTTTAIGGLNCMYSNQVSSDSSVDTSTTNVHIYNEEVFYGNNHVTLCPTLLLCTINYILICYLLVFFIKFFPFPLSES